MRGRRGAAAAAGSRKVDRLSGTPANEAALMSLLSSLLCPRRREDIVELLLCVYVWVYACASACDVSWPLGPAWTTSLLVMMLFPGAEDKERELRPATH